MHHFFRSNLYRFATWISLLTPALAGSLDGAEPDLFVATNGNDTWSGRLAAPNAEASDGPLASVAAAQRAVRELRLKKPVRERPIVVAIRGGTYWLDEPLLFDPEDSGSEAAPIVYQALGDERPILSGGRSITGWKVDQRGHWHVDLAEAKNGRWGFSQLFVNDQRRFRPRLPKQGYFKIAQEVEPSPKAAGKGHDRFGFQPDNIRADSANLEDVEVMAFHHWAASRMRVAEVDSKNNVVTVHGNTTGSSGWAQFKKDHRFLVINAKEALGEPGSWYLDRPTGRLTSIPFNEA